METSPDLKALYTMLREQIQHEDHLVNHRLTWLLAVEGYLFAILAALLSQDFTPASKIFLLLIFGGFGIAFGSISLLSIRAANESLTILREKWDEPPTGSLKMKNAWIAARKKYPPITYVGGKYTNAWTAAEGTPKLILFTWFALVGCLIFKFVQL